MGRTKFHLSLNVRDLARTAEFLELLLGMKPAQLHADYAKFELDEPPLVLSLAPTDLPARGGVNHLGFRLADRQALASLEARLVARGIAYDYDESVACCHSRQTKLWVRDPAGNLWELYVLEDESECVPEPISIAPRNVTAHVEQLHSTWAHRLGEAVPDRIQAADGTLDEVVLEGTVNARLLPDQPAAILHEAARVLRPGGKLLLRALTADQVLQHPPALPGPAAEVQHVPTCGEVLDAIANAGFLNLELLTYGETYRFQHAGAELRETRIRARRSATGSAPLDRVVIYRGPFPEVRDDSGQIFRRGEQSYVNELTWTRLQEGSREQFIFEPRDDFVKNSSNHAYPRSSYPAPAG